MKMTGIDSGGISPPETAVVTLSESKGDKIQDFIVLIDSRRLERECFVRSIELLHPRLIVLGFSSAEDFSDYMASSGSPRANAVLLSVDSRNLSHSGVGEELEQLLNRENASPVVVLAPSDNLDQMIAALEAGASGYIPAGVGIDGIIEATKLAASGGVFLKLESLSKLRQSIGQTIASSPELLNLTGRQVAVGEALRRGKANKMIAYELSMCESTVKVHVRNIMRKLNATNRTEAAFKLNAILPPK